MEVAESRQAEIYFGGIVWQLMNTKHCPRVEEETMFLHLWQVRITSDIYIIDILLWRLAWRTTYLIPRKYGLGTSRRKNGRS